MTVDWPLHKTINTEIFQLNASFMKVQENPAEAENHVSLSERDEDSPDSLIILTTNKTLQLILSHLMNEDSTVQFVLFILLNK